MTDLAQRPHHPIAAPVGRLEAWRTRARRFGELAVIALRSPTTVIGLVLAFLYERTRSLIPSMIAHGLWNSGTFTFALVLFGSN